MSSKEVSLSGLGLALHKPLDLEEPPVHKDGYSLTTLDREHWMYKEITIDLENAGLKVKTIEVLSNHVSWQRYVAERKAMQERLPQDPAFLLNEKYLYHGTTAPKETICVEGLDSRLSRTGRFGKGIYFSDYPLKCVKYSEKSDQEPFLLLERVILGQSKVYPDGEMDPKLKREPEKKLPYIGWRFFDSVVGRPKDYKEFVIYNNTRALIECIVTYSQDKSVTEECNRAIKTSSPNTSVKKPDSVFSYEHKLQPLLANCRESANQHEDSSSCSSDEEDTKDRGRQQNVDTSSDEEGADDAGNSSDSSLDDYNTIASTLNSSSKLSVSSTGAIPKVMTGEDVLRMKKEEFMTKTREHKEDVIEWFLSAASLDVDNAIKLYEEKDNKRKEALRAETKSMEKKEPKEEESEALKNWRKQVETWDSVADKQSWRNLSEADKTAVLEALTENFLTVVELDKNGENEMLGRDILRRCDFNLDMAISYYYESSYG